MKETPYLIFHQSYILTVNITSLTGCEIKLLRNLEYEYIWIWTEYIWIAFHLPSYVYICV